MIETKNAGPRTIDLNESESKSASLTKPDKHEEVCSGHGSIQRHWV